ncbi:uncharacterized protein ACO6RY_16740 [Pungitius sinensis]
MHNIQAVGCKRRNFGQERCGLLCLHGHITDCSNAHRLPHRPHFSEKEVEDGEPDHRSASACRHAASS